MSISHRVQDSMVDRLFATISELNQAIVDKESAIHQLDQELLSCEQEHAWMGTECNKASDSEERLELKQLREEEKLLENDISSVTGKIDRADEHIKQIEKAISHLEADKQGLINEIEDRSILVAIVKYVFGDTEREELIRIEDDIQHKRVKRKDLFKTKEKLISGITVLTDRRNALENALFSVHARIERLTEAKLSYARKQRDARNTYKTTSKQISARKQDVNKQFEKAWVAALHHLNELCNSIRRRQPHLNELTSENINTGTHFPDALAFGRMHLAHQNWNGYVPRLIPFPFKKSLWLPDKNTKYRLIHQLLLRLIHCIPVGNVEVIAADPLRLGTSLTQ